jgi:putative membrane protein
MDIVVNLIFWLHFIGLGMGVGGGIALGLTGPRLKTAKGSELDLVWQMEATFSRLATVGIATLLVTGPLMVWLRFGGFEGFSWWFGLKMGFVALAVVGAGLHEWAGRRHRAGLGGYRLMEISGRLAGGSLIAAILCAVFAFN